LNLLFNSKKQKRDRRGGEEEGEGEGQGEGEGRVVGYPHKPKNSNSMQGLGIRTVGVKWVLRNLR
jgi:hypothetical protein